MTAMLLRNVQRVTAASEAPTDVRLDARGVVTELGRDLAPNSEEQVHEGGYLSPGWTDLHTHVYWGATDISVRVRDAGAASGVTTVVDAGSAGEANIAGFREYCAEPAHERVFALLNLGSIGLVKTNVVSELEGIHGVDLDRMAEVLEHEQDLIKGVKIRASHVILREWGLEPFKVARKMARRAGMPLMVHVGEPPPLIEDVLDRLDAGDILTHCFNGKVGGNVFDDADAYRSARAAHDRGVVFDLGHGNASFSFAVARRAIEEGLAPTTISTDLHGHNIGGPVYDMPTTMSKMLHVGTPFDEVITAVTAAADRALALGDRSETWCAVGEPLDGTLFDLVERPHVVRDSLGDEETIDRWFAPRWTFLHGRATQAANRFLDGVEARGTDEP